MKRRNTWLLLFVLLAAALVLAGCGVPREGVDTTTTPPEGFWQAAVVWPLANSLIWLARAMENMRVPYYWGFAIILFTLLVKLVTFPLNLTQLRSMQAQKELQPRIQELQKKYGKDREKLAQEQMKLYQEAGVNPLSGCLPLLIQMPILFGLYSALVALGDKLSGQGFFWIPDLNFPSYTLGLGWLPENFRAGNYGLLAAYLVLPILLIVTQFLMQKMTPTAAAGDAAKSTQQITYMMTFMFGFFTLQVPAGLTLYWVTSNLLQMLQQWFVTSDRFKLAQSGSVSSKLANSPAGADAPAAVTTVEGQSAPRPTSPAKQPAPAKRRKAKRK